MKITWVSLENFGPFYGQHKVNLDNRGLLLLAGKNHDEPAMESNGSGKSYFIDAIDWCTFGKNPRGDPVMALYNELAAKERGSRMVVSICYFDQAINREIIITRTKSKSVNSLELVVNGKLFESLDSNVTQAEIEKELGVDRDIIHATVLFGQNDLVRYADSSDAARMDILTKILQMTAIDNYLEKTKVLKKQVEDQQQEISNKLQRVVGSLSGLQTIDYSQRIAEWENRRNETVANIQSAIAAKNDVLAELNAMLEVEPSLQLKRSGIVNTLAELNKALSELKDPRLNMVNGELSQLNGVINSYSYEINLQSSKIEKFQKMNEGECSNCGQPVTATHLAKEIQLARDSITKNQGFIGIEKTKQQQLEKAKAAFELELQNAKGQITQQIDQINAEINSINFTLHDLQSKKTDAARVRNEITAYQRDLEREKTSVNPFMTEREKTQAQILSLDGDRVLLEGQLATLDQRLEYLSFWVLAFGFKGLKSYILDTRLNELTDAANYWVRKLTGGTIWVRFEAQKKKGKGLKNSPDIRVFRWNPSGTITERSYRSWSGGEKQRISLAVDFGLSRLIANRAKQSYDIFITDETFKHLDGAGKDSVVDLLQELSLEKSTVLVVDHSRDIQNQFENTLWVEKKNERSNFIEGDQNVVTSKKSENEAKQHTESTRSRANIRRIPKRQPIKRAPRKA